MLVVVAAIHRQLHLGVGKIEEHLDPEQLGPKAGYQAVLVLTVSGRGSL